MNEVKFEKGQSEHQGEEIRGVLLRWRAPEYEIYEKGRNWYLYAALFLAAIVAYAIWMDSPVMAITFILIGVVGYIFINKEPKTIDFMITGDGIAAGREFYDFDNIRSFWIFYEPDNRKVISLHLKNKLLPYAHIPAHDQDPAEIRRVLLEYIPEAKQEPSLVDAFERLLGI